MEKEHKKPSTNRKSIVLDWNLRMELLKAGVGDEMISISNSKLKLAETKSISNQKGVFKVRRSSFITRALIDNEVGVHNGKTFVRVKVHKGMVGHRFGEFVNTSVWGGGVTLSKNLKSTKQPVKGKGKVGSSKK